MVARVRDHSNSSKHVARVATVTMNKKEVIDFLGISPRTLTNYVKRGEISVRYERGKNGQVAVFDPDEVKTLKERLSVEHHRPAVLPPQSPDRENSLPVQGGTVVPAEYLLQALQTLALASPRKRELLITEVAVKPVLRLKEASLLSGFSEKHLRGAIKEGRLNGRKIDRSWRIERGDLETYVKSLFL
jgi:hypothetical protein